MLDLLKNQLSLSQIEWQVFTDEIHNLSLFIHHTPKAILTPLEVQSIEYTYTQTSLFGKISENADYYSFLNSITLIEDLPHIPKMVGQILKGMNFDLKNLNPLILLFESAIEFKLLFKSILTDSSQFDLNLQQVHKNLINPFRKVVNTDGELNFFAHPELKLLYQKQLQLEDKIRKCLHEYQNDPKLASTLQFTGQDIINDYYTIAVKSDNYSSNIGKVIARSESGNSIYIEPFIIKDLNFERIETLIKIQDMIFKIANEFLSSINKYSIEINFLLEICLFFDEIQTRLAFAKKFNLSPPILKKEPTLRLYNLFHPLISNPVANDFVIDSSHKGLVISGPNTGGKTALLKAAALSVSFVKYGLYVPAVDAEIFPYDSLFYFSNDLQNLQEGLSSFSAEVSNYTQLVDQLGPSNLIIIDEIFNSTSSDEASALSIAFINYINNISNSHLILSTHHQMLKTFIHQDDDFISCHVGFNLETNQPTYELKYGLPGSSMALEVFRNIVNHTKDGNLIYLDAIKHLDSKHVSYETLLSKIVKKESEIDKILAHNRTLNSQLVNQKQAMEGILKIKLEEKLLKADSKIKKLISNAEDLLSQTKNNSISKKQFYGQSSEIKSHIREMQPATDKSKTTERKLYKPDKISIGDKYFSQKLNCEVLVTHIDAKKKFATVSKGIISTKVNIIDLYISQNTSNKKAATFSFYIPEVGQSKIEHDLRGYRLEEFQQYVESVIGELLLAQVPHLSLIHGHGDGVLKKWLRQFVNNHKDLIWEQGAEGNDGETRIFLKS